jgi:hypothetical protein
MTDGKKPVQNLSELIDELDSIREQLFHVQKSLEKFEVKSDEATLVKESE